MARILFILLFIEFLFGPGSNLKQAHRNFDEKKYKEAAEFLTKALVEYPEKSAEIWFNLGQCHYAIDSIAKALDGWGKAMDKKDPKLASLALNNAGVVAADKNQKIDEALEAFKEALRRDPNNEDARYNYELLKKRAQQSDQKQDPKKDDQKKEDQKRDQNKDQNQDQQKQDQKKDQDSKDEQQSDEQNKSTSKQNQNKKPTEGKGEEGQYKQISPEQAKMILEGMKENEKQFIQQLRKSPKTKPENDGKPAW